MSNPASITIDFSQVEPPARGRAPKPRKKMERARQEVPTVESNRAAVEAMLPAVADVAPRGTPLPTELLEAAKATFVRSGGNVAEVARVHDLTAQKVLALANEHKWPVYGQGTTHGQIARKTRLENLATMLESQLFDIADSLGIERKKVDDITEKGLGSKFVAPLTQRSTAFSVVFDRYMRVMALLEPEVFAADDDPSNPVAAKIRQRQSQDALGGVDGIDRKMAEFAARVAVSTIEEMEARRVIEGEVVDVTPTD